MGFLTKSAKGEETGPSEGAQLEEQYEKLFPKIGRDFVSRRDFAKVLQTLLSLLDPSGLLSIDFDDDSEARSLAIEYKGLIDAGKDGSRLYKDLIKLDDEEEDGQS